MTKRPIRIFSGCNKTSVVVDASTGKVVASIKNGTRVDALGWDPSKKLIFIPNGGEGNVTVVHQDSPDKYTEVATVATFAGAKTIRRRTTPTSSSPSVAPLPRHRLTRRRRHQADVAAARRVQSSLRGLSSSSSEGILPDAFHQRIRVQPFGRGSNGSQFSRRVSRRAGLSFIGCLPRVYREFSGPRLTMELR